MSDHTGVNSAMLASMSKHGGESDHSSSHPVTQAQNVNTSWNKPVFENKNRERRGGEGYKKEKGRNGTSKHPPTIARV